MKQKNTQQKMIKSNEANIGLSSPSLRTPALIEAAQRGDAKFFVQFSGQAGHYMEELRDLYTAYPMIRSYIEKAAHVLKNELKNPQALKSGFYTQGFAVLDWIQDPKGTPAVSYLASSPISQPLIYITQVVNYLVVTHYACDDKTLQSLTAGTTGHSQGIMAAVLIALKADDKKFEETFLKMVEFLFWQGHRMQQSFAAAQVHPALEQECKKEDWGKPSTMASISGLTKDQLQAYLDKINSGLEDHDKIYLTLLNGWKRYIISGSAAALVLLRRLLKFAEDKAKDSLTEMFKIQWEFLPVSSAFHCPHMQKGLDLFRNDQQRIGLDISAKDLTCPVYATNDGRDLRQSADLVEDLLQMQYLQEVDWDACTLQAKGSKGITHILDFGPGEGASTLTFMNREGDGVVVIPCAVKRGRDELFSTDAKALRFAHKTWESYAPRLVSVGGKKTVIENKYTCFTGRPPIFGGGMTPTSVEPDIVVAAMNNGYLVEWAGGGQVTEEILRKRLDQLVAKLNPGQGIVFNALYLDAYLWNLHFPLLSKLKKEGYPIIGLTVSAGIPSREKASEILQTLNENGIWFNSFKPGSDEQIRSVLEIAEDHPDLTIVMQIEGGKAGGHHSWEDLYGLLERNYAKIRRYENIIICAGGGIGTEDKAYKLLSGTWHDSGRIMPIDAVILGTRLMACQEAKTSESVKKLLVQVQGTEKWVNRHEFNGGVTSGQSQLGADVHYVDNRMSRVADEIDQISNLKEDEILAKKDHIIAILEKTAKPYFGDVENMTYAQVLHQMIAFMAPGNMPNHFIYDGAFFDKTFRERVYEFARLTVSRFKTELQNIQDEPVLRLASPTVLDDPQKFLNIFLEKLPQTKDTILHPEDVDAFMNLCRSPGKPVNFVPVIDKNIKRWFKGDSLWQAHDPRYAADQVLVIPGPEAVSGISKVDEPVAEVFGRFVKHVVDRLCDSATLRLCEVAYLGETDETDINVSANDFETVILKDGKELEIRPVAKSHSRTVAQSKTRPVENWIKNIASQGTGPISALLKYPRILEGTQFKDNFIPKLLAPKDETIVRIDLHQGQMTSLRYFDGNVAPAVVIQWPQDEKERSQVLVHIYHNTADGRELRLDLPFTYQPQETQAPLKLNVQHFEESLRAFYYELWVGETENKAISKDIWQLFESDVQVTSEAIAEYASVVGDTSGLSAKGIGLPSLAVVLLWKPLSQCLLQKGLKINLLNLLHLSNEFTVADNQELKQGETLRAKVQLESLTQDASGKTVVVTGGLYRGEDFVLKMESQFLVRQTINADDPVFELHQDKDYQITINDVTKEILESKDWFKASKKIKVGDQLVFKLNIKETHHHNQSKNYAVKGDVYHDDQVVGHVQFTQKDSTLKQNAVLFFLNRFDQSKAIEKKQKEGLAFQEEIASPFSNEPYALVSKDLNPIHTDEHLAALAGLINTEGQAHTIVHGMWTSAASLTSLMRHFPEKITYWKSEFVGMVHSNQALQIKGTHVSNLDGERVVQVITENQDGQIVHRAQARVVQKKTAYLFTGQGSQVPGMGMEAYESSEVARQVWDRADAFTQIELGFSILKVVRDNPKEMLVNGQTVFHPKGVLNLTQFSQVSLTVLAMAQIEELKAAGLYKKDAIFAGHSLGEYAALSNIGVLTIENVVRTVYHRGLTMQNFVPRDENGVSPYGMIVIRPNVVGWSQDDLDNIVNELTQSSKSEAIYVVNYNIEGSQYSVTGHKTLLKKLEDKAKEIEKRINAKKTTCIWLDGVDVPFHSPILIEGVTAFRKTLEKTITANAELPKLVDRYIPNLNAKPFRLDKDYFEAVFAQTKSEVLKDVLAKWASYKEDKQELARLLLIELLAYQFASPVRWIETQKVLLTNPKYAVEKVVEVGPSPVLSIMMMATLRRVKIAMPPQIFQFEENRKAVFQELQLKEEQVASDSETPAPQTVAANTVATLAASAPVAANVPVPADRPYAHDRGLKTLLALKLNIRLDEIKDNDTIEKLSGGNSAKRNELLSDIGAEFQVDALDDAHLLPMTKLVELLEKSVDYSEPGAFLQKSIDRAMKEKLPLSKQDIVSYLTGERLLPAGLAKMALSSVALFVRSGASRKSGDLSNIGLDARISDKAAANSWLEKMVDEFGKLEGLAIPHKSQMGQGGGAAVSEEALNEWQEKYFGKNGPFAKWAKDLSEICGWTDDDQSTQENYQEQLSQLKLYQEAFGTNIEKVIQPLFNLNKKVSFTSVWNWGRSEFLRLFWKHIQDETTFSTAEFYSLSNQLMDETKQTVRYFAEKAKVLGRKDLVAQLTELAEQSCGVPSVYKPMLNLQAPSLSLSDKGDVAYVEKPRQGVQSVSDFIKDVSRQGYISTANNYVDVLQSIEKQGINFTNKVALITGASPGSIAWEVMKNLLSGGAKVIATTTSYHDNRLLAYRRIYQKYAGRGAELHVFPFSQGSQVDVKALIKWAFDHKLVPDYVFPFGAVGEMATLTMMTPDASTATLRVLLQGVQWIIGAIAQQHKETFSLDKKTEVILPLSPNHGIFGGDGSYADAKIGLESLLNRWHGEHDDWGKFISVVGATIGWVRGTGLMDANNMIASKMEEQGLRTFSSEEMGYLLTSLCHADIRAQAEKNPLKINLAGGFEKVQNLASLAQKTRVDLEKQSLKKKEIFKIRQEEQDGLYGQNQVRPEPKTKTPLRSRFPSMPQQSDLKRCQTKALQSLDPSQVVVVVGYGEVSPFGSSQPRWEMECGEVSLEGVIELAWIMGLIRYEDGTGKTKYQGWVDAKTAKAVADDEMWDHYGQFITENTGIRFADPEMQNFDPQSVLVFGNVVLESSLSFQVDDEAQVQEYLKQYPETAKVQQDASGSWQITLPQGSVVKVPRRVKMTRWVAGQIPKGWDATRFGISKEIADNIDRNTLFNMVSTAQAFDTAGIEPKKLYDHLSPARVGNTQGGGMGGMHSLDRMYHDHREDLERQGDILQETLINVGPAWVTQSLVGSYGPMVHPVAACATSLVSLAVGVDQILQGKADFVVTGGYDDYSEEGVIGFQDMAATCDTQEMLDKGISPKGMSRPNDARRGGFVEAQGGGTLLLSRLDKAIEAGLPIYAILAHADSYSDGIHTSIPAPGLGILSMAQKTDDRDSSSLVRTLEKFGLTADDITAVSKHDTSTNANDPNENNIHDTLQKTLGRTPGLPLYVHSQKSILGHAKGGAGAWQSIAAVQMIQTGKVPGNKNLEDVDAKMRRFTTMSFSDQTLDIGDRNIRSVLCTSLGFGHVGAATLFVHPDYALALFDEKTLQSYFEKRKQREVYSQQRKWRVLMGKEALFTQRKDRPEESAEIKMLLDK